MIGEKLDALLKAKGIKPGTLASETGISKNTIYGIIKRNNKKVDVRIMEKIAAALDVPMDYFFGGGSDEGEKKDQLEPEVDELDEFMELFEKLTPEQKAFILSAMRGILAEQ